MALSLPTALERHYGFTPAIIFALLLTQLGHGRFALPWLALVVGIHFFGMGAAFHASIHHWVGTAMCLSALVSLIWLPSGQPLGPRRG
ncbi:MAG: hypothetical protein JO077_14205 [Verrucomicrobia bacterium]|nr:hypothetical protein [Verrucomicrobiota bacterium]